jgi:hypothetical protein
VYTRCLRGKKALIAVVVMVLVLVGAWVATRTGGGGSATVEVLRFDPLAVTELRLGGDGPEERLHRLESGAWVVESAGAVWPVDDSVLRGAMRKLVGLRGEPSDGAFDAAATLVIEGASGELATLRMSAERLAGRGLAEVSVGGETTTALVDGELLDVFTRSGLLPWRERTALPLLASAGASAVTIESGETAITLGKVRGRWGMTAPMRERCDEARVNAVLRTMSGIEFVRFAGDDEVDVEAAPSAALDITMVRQGETLRQRFAVLGAADIGGEHVFVSVSLERNGVVWAGATGVVKRETLDEIPLAAEWYASRRTWDAAPADVARVWISRVGEPATPPLLPDPEMNADATLERTIDGWAGPDMMKGALYERASEALLAQLCDVDAAEVGPELPEGYTPIALVQIGGRDGLPVGVAEIGVAETEGGQVAIVRSGHLNRVYDDVNAVGLVGAVVGE